MPFALLLLFDVLGTLFFQAAMANLFDWHWPDSFVQLVLLAIYVVLRRAWRALPHIPALIGPVPKQPKTWLLLGAGLSAAMFINNVGMSVTLQLLKLLPSIPKIIEGSMSAKSVVTPQRIFIMVVCAPIVEELFFRGYLFREFSKRHGRTFAIVIPSLIFGCLHLNPIGTVPFALIMSAISLRTGSLILPMIIHALYNATLLMPLPVPFWYVGFAFGVPCFIWLMWGLWWKRNHDLTKQP